MLVTDVIKQAQVHLNDVRGTNFTFEALVGHLNTAMAELQEEFEINNVPSTTTVSTDITVPEGETEVAFFADPPHARLPDDLIEPQKLWQRQSGIDPYIPMTKLNFLPLNWEGTPINQFTGYVWEEQKLKFLPANTDVDLRIEYVRSLFRPVTSEADRIYIINSLTFLAYRTAGLASRFIGENNDRADSLDQMALLAMNRVLGISAKGRQSITVRRRPFLANFKRRGWR